MERPLLACAVERRRFPVGASPTRQPLQPEAIGAVMEVTKWLKPSISVSRIGDSARVLHTRSETMAEDDETATARYIAGNISTQLMLKTVVEIIGTMADDPDSDLRLFRILSLASLRRSAGRQRIRST